MSGLTRKKIKVRGKSGKTFQRSVMVRAEAIGKRAGGKKLNSLNPWQTHHIEGVNTNTRLGERQKAYGSSGPGSDHSWFAHMVGIIKPAYATHDTTRILFPVDDHNYGGATHAEARRAAGLGAAQVVGWGNPSGRGIARELGEAFTVRSPEVREGLIARHGRDNVHEVYQDPRRHVRT